MGNRPQATKIAYMATAIFFGILMAYLLFCSVWLTYKGVQATLATLHAEDQQFGQNFGDTVKAVVGNRLFRDLILSTLSTYGLYLISSLMFFDAAHMVTSFIQYLLVSPLFVNLLYILYPFCLMLKVELCMRFATRMISHGERREIIRCKAMLLLNRAAKPRPRTPIPCITTS
jgi:chitin synthase